jgi:LacI family transcriptional regulator
MPKSTVRSLAADLGLSRSTVSLALRGSPLITADTRQRVLGLAAKAGCTLNLLASSLMSEMRRGHADRGEPAAGVVARLWGVELALEGGVERLPLCHAIG